MPRVVTALFALVCLGAPLRGQPPVFQPPTFEQVLASYGASFGLDALKLRVQWMRRLAMTEDARAVPVLRKRYAKPDDPARQVRFLVASCLQDLVEVEAVREPLADWLTRCGARTDPWLRYNLLLSRVASGQQGAEDVAAIVGAEKATPMERATALRALAWFPRPEETGEFIDIVGESGEDFAGLDLEEAPAPRHPYPQLLVRVVTELLSRPKLMRTAVDQRLITGACAAALLAAEEERGTEAYLEAARPLVELLDDPHAEWTAKLVIRRHLARILDAEPELGAHEWLALLGAPREPEDAVEETVVPGSTFLGMYGHGRRVVYIIDWSNSMMTPLTATERKELGGGKLARELPWENIHNRFDVARESLRLSLSALERDMYFAVITFGDHASPLRMTKSLMPAIPKHIDRVLAELDRVRPGPATEDYPHGTLGGSTNLHGALVMAFRMTQAKPLRDDLEHVDRQTLLQGCDLVFVLSDGLPNCDDYPGIGPVEKNRGSYDAESGRVRESSGGTIQYTYTGPYTDLDFFLRDFQRMNLLRHVELHCIGIGEPDSKWLRGIAELGMGKVRLIDARE